MANVKVAGDLYYELDGQLLEIKRQLRQPSGYPFNPLELKLHLQRGIEGWFAVNLQTIPIWRTVTSGLTRDQLIANARANGRLIVDHVIELLISKSGLVFTSGITYRLVLIPGNAFATDEERIYANMQLEGLCRRGLLRPPVEVALLLAQFTQQELGYWELVVMHEPIFLCGEYYVLSLYQSSSPQCPSGRLSTTSVHSDSRFKGKTAGVFLAPPEYSTS